MYMYLEYTSTTSIGQRWNIGNHGRDIKINTITETGNKINFIKAANIWVYCMYYSTSCVQGTFKFAAHIHVTAIFM